MPNEQIKKDGNDWEANTVYYWPNDPRTSLDFYAYSPFLQNSNTPSQTLESVYNHQILNGNLSHTRTYNYTTVGSEQVIESVKRNVLKLEGYTHNNMYVDFMVADSVRNATYSEPDGVQNSTALDGIVPVKFRHQMTQIIFTVNTNAAYNAKFKVNSITLNNIINKATYTYDYNASATWTPDATPSVTDYTIFPAVKFDATNAPNGCPEADFVTQSAGTEVTQQASPTNVFKTAAVTMIPQTLANQTFTIEYTVEGTGIAPETVVKTFKFTDAEKPTDAPAAWTVQTWKPNKKVTYNLFIGLNKITFSPEVELWDPTDGTGEYDITPGTGTPSTAN